MNSSFNLTVNRRLGVFIGSECALFESERAQAGHNPVIGPPPLLGFASSKAAGVVRMVKQEQVGGRDVAPIGAGLQVPRALPVGLHQARRLFEQARTEALSELAQSRRSLEMAIRGRVEGTDAPRLPLGAIPSDRRESRDA